jgi:O-antigen/teichoic acid export membrane protein
MSRTARAANGFITGVLQYLSQILIQALLAPFVLKLAGRETLGAFGAIMQVVGFIALTDIVGSWSLERFLSQAAGLDDGGERFRTIFSTARTVFIFCAGMYSILVLIFSFYIAQLFHLSLPVAHQAQHALFVVAAWAFLRTPLAAYSTASVATQDIAMVNMIGTVLGVCRVVASLGFLLAGYGLFGLILSGTVVEVFGYTLYWVRFKQKNPRLMPGWGIRDKALLKQMFSFGGHATLINLGNSLMFNSGVSIAGMTNGAAMASTFYTTQMPTTTAYNMMQRLSDSAAPAINELWGRKEVVKVQNALRRITRLLLMLTLPLSVGVLMFNRDLVTTWVGAGQYGGTLLTASLAAYCVVISLQRVVIVYWFAFGWMRLLTITCLLQGAANFGLAFYLSKVLGIGGITLALVVVILPQTFLLWHRVGKFLEVNVITLLAECFARAILPLAVAAFAGWQASRFVTIGRHHFWDLAAELAAFVVAYAATAYPLVLLKQDREQIKSYVGSLLVRKRTAPAS